MSEYIPTILVVDDEPRNIQVVSNVLKESFECKIVYATNGEQAIERAQKNEIDLVLLDMMMPVMDGLETCSAFRSNPKFENLPIVFLTAKNDEESLVSAFDAGATDYISKPFLRRELLARVSTQLKLRSVQQSLTEELSDNKELLKQYRQIVDASSIVTKTDPSGRITFANDKFCQMSGYEREELIGKPHNIVRDPDVGREVFKEMWENLKAKQSWNGIVKNRKKNGDVYYVDSFVAPILDSRGEVSEYISIRTDITEIVELKEEIEATQKELLLTLGYVGESRSKETANHVRRVAEYAKVLASEYGLSEEECDCLWLVAPMHDIGKIGIPDRILNKPGKLDEDEFEQMKRHAELGWYFFKNSARPLLQSAAIVSYEHHERWDGKGYPRGLSGEDIHIFGRITAVADVFDALMCKRVYKEAWSTQDVLRYFEEQSAGQFDPKLVDILIHKIDVFTAILEEFKDVQEEV